MLLVLLASIVGSFGAVFLKKGSVTVAGHSLLSFLNPSLALGVALLSHLIRLLRIRHQGRPALRLPMIFPRQHLDPDLVPALFPGSHHPREALRPEALFWLVSPWSASAAESTRWSAEHCRAVGMGHSSGKLSSGKPLSA